MATIKKDDFYHDWEIDWVLRTLLIDHYIFWRGTRKDTGDAKRLKFFLAHHSLANSGHNLDNLLMIYSMRGYFLQPNQFNYETGLIPPENLEIVLAKIQDDYSLDRFVQPGYSMADFLWDIYGQSKSAEFRMAETFANIFEESVGFDTAIFKDVDDDGTTHEYLKLSWEVSEDKFAWWIAFQPGNYVRKDDDGAKGLVKSKAFDLQSISMGMKSSTQFWSLCAIDIGDKAKIAVKEVNDKYNLGASYSLILAISLVKLVNWGDHLSKAKKDSQLKKFAKFFENQDNPLSARKGIKNIES